MLRYTNRALFNSALQGARRDGTVTHDNGSQVVVELRDGVATFDRQTMTIEID